MLDRFILCEIFLARLKLACGEVDTAASLLNKAEQTARKKNFLLRLPEVAAVQVLVLLKQGNLLAAADLARQFDLPLTQARVLLAQGDPTYTVKAHVRNIFAKLNVANRTQAVACGRELDIIA